MEKTDCDGRYAMYIMQPTLKQKKYLRMDMDTIP